MCSSVALPVEKERPSQPAKQVNPVVFAEPVDTVGQAAVRSRRAEPEAQGKNDVACLALSRRILTLYGFPRHFRVSVGRESTTITND